MSCKLTVGSPIQHSNNIADEINMNADELPVSDSSSNCDEENSVSPIHMDKNLESINHIEEKNDVKTEFTVPTFALMNTSQKDLYPDVPLEKLPGPGKKYECPMCARKFKQAFHVKRHMVTHTGERNFKCKICDKSFKRDDYLKVHYLMHAGVRPHHCPECEKSFYTSADMRKHMFTHSQEKKYKCHLCERAYRRPPDLRKHLASHLLESFKCCFCNKTYPNETELRGHVLDCLSRTEVYAKSRENSNQ